MASTKLTPFNPLLHFVLFKTIPYCNMLPVLLRFRIFLHTYFLSAFRFVLRYVFRFRNDVQRSELMENGGVDSEHSEFWEKESGEMEMDGEDNGKTRSSVFCSVSMETISSLKMGDSEFTRGSKEVGMDNVDCTLSYVQSTALDIVSKGLNSDGLKSTNIILDVYSENNASNVFDVLPEPEVQVLWEDYPDPSDSESAEESTSGSPKTNHDQVDDSSCKEIKQLDSFNNFEKEKEKESVNASEESTEASLQEKPSMLNYDHRYELNYLPDHQDIVQQLEMELRNARTGGLPTIFEEEAETAEAINEKFKYEEVMGEIQKVYRIYAEKMWKLDILNNQIMHVIGLQHLKYPLQSVPVQNSQSSQLWLGKARRLGADPILVFLGDLSRDIETVYVGQVCLSWEILQWQLRKSLELQRYDSQGIRQYNQVASEFQLFQVMLKRFMEGERLQGNRVNDYVQNRCVFRSLLQVPPIIEAEGREREDDYDFSSNFLAEIIEKSMWVFYEFLVSDKDHVKNILKCNRKHQIELENSENPQLLLVNVQDHFHKSERKVKDLLSRNKRCSSEKLGKQEEAGLSYSLMLLIAQVDLKLISRVLRMGKLTVDQLLWCSQKLDHLTFINRQVHLEPSLLLFPF
ncbi:uncharacterized protein LOC111449746 isoform X2 [Cucurbita moschata]|uniref:Uncharacterized protein LOC111449746 isoform X2 n=1 Tax=Cucurbita moschata TaxID=3662 RepID=A0A6J1G193_CUCMO|nr:uncharacterized protein LOC111449746 isoform X2 [Cucurbita moschata]